MKVNIAAEVNPRISKLVEIATASTMKHRGGRELVATILAQRDVDDLLRDAVSQRGLFVARDGDEAVGFALCRDGVLEAVYVDRRFRRKGIARTLVNAVVASSSEPLDAYALPGDRATKSLYESFGWKARLLTMRAG